MRKKLKLSLRTIRRLSEAQAQDVAGGVSTPEYYCVYSNNGCPLTWNCPQPPTPSWFVNASGCQVGCFP